MKKLVVKILAAVCMVFGFGVMMYAFESGNNLALLIGLGIFALLIPISNSYGFKDSEEDSNEKETV